MSSAPAGEVAHKLAELGLHLNPQIFYNLDSMFPKLSGWGAKGEIKAKHKLVTNVEGFLARVLRPKEEVLYVAKGVQYKFSEQYFLGAWAALINQTVFVFHHCVIAGLTYAIAKKGLFPKPRTAAIEVAAVEPVEN